MSTEEGRQKLIAMALQLFGEDGIHCLVNNVGTNIRKKSQDYSVEEYRKIMDTNLDSAFLLSNSFYPYLKKNKNSAIVNIGSVAGMRNIPPKSFCVTYLSGYVLGGCQTSLRSGVVYAMTKAAMNQMTYNQACEWAADGIRVNAVCPWYIDTPLARPVLENPESLKEVLGRTPMNRVGNVEEVSSITAFLLMDKASYITGQNVAVDGGFTRNGFY